MTTGFQIIAANFLLGLALLMSGCSTFKPRDAGWKWNQFLSPIWSGWVRKSHSTTKTFRPSKRRSEPLRE